MSEAQDLMNLDIRSFADEVKARLRDDARWAVMAEPDTIVRTRKALTRMIASIDVQKERAALLDSTDAKWVYGVNLLRRYAKARLDVMAPLDDEAMVSETKSSRAWRAFGARLAQAMSEGDCEALDTIQTPYGGLTTREWLAAREEKQSQK